jgi:hypothetical protein
LTREWLLYVGLMGAVFVLLFRNDSLIGIVAGLLVSGPLYLALGYVLAKFGYQRKSLKELRAEAPVRGSKRSSGKADTAGVSGPKPKPAPTSRTGGAPARGAAKRRR